MSKPYIICHMMTSLDGRIDCAMTSKLKGVEDYYYSLDELDVPTTLSGRVTAELEMALPGKFESDTVTPNGKFTFSKKFDAEGYEIVVDTKGTLLWEEQSDCDKPLLIITSEGVSKEYLSYLDGKNISYISVGKGKIDLEKACEVLNTEFGVERMGIVGGPRINTAFLEAGLLDEVSILLGVGIDGRAGMSTVFDGLDMQHDVTPLSLIDVTKFDSGALWIRYKTIN